MNVQKLLVLTLIFLIPSLLASQSAYYSFESDISFAEYLIKNKLNDDALILLKNLNKKKQPGNIQADSINYLIAGIYYDKQQYDSAEYYYNMVSRQCSLYTNSQFFSANASLKSGSFNTAENKLQKLSEVDTTYHELLYYNLSCLSLLQRNNKSFNEYFNKNSFTKDLAEEKKRLQSYYLILGKQQSKSPFVAASLSTLVPGLGKVYAGRPKQGLTTFLPVAILGVQTYEAYHQSGFKNARFIIFSSLFSVFYIGNIWGSALCVKFVNNENNNEINRQIILDMDIPLQRIFR